MQVYQIIFDGIYIKSVIEKELLSEKGKLDIGHIYSNFLYDFMNPFRGNIALEPVITGFAI
jgi:hypothetical protein